MKYTFNIHAEHIPPKLVLEQMKGEAEAHIILKLLSYLIFYRQGMKIEHRVEQHFKPDLVVEGANFQPVLWVDCGNTAIRKLDKVATKNHNCDIYIVKENSRQLDAYFQKAKKRVKRIERVRFICFDDGFVAALVNRLRRTNEVTFNLLQSDDKDSIVLAFNGENYTSTIKKLSDAQGNNRILRKG